MDGAVPDYVVQARLGLTQSRLPANILDCGIDPATFRCNDCQKPKVTPNGVYEFDDDLAVSAPLVRAVKAFVQYHAVQDGIDIDVVSTLVHKNADIAIRRRTALVARIEAKQCHQQFWAASEMLTAELGPCDTLPIDEPKLNHYFEQRDHDQKWTGRDIPTVVVWRLDRHCPKTSGSTVFQDISVLEQIYRKNQGVARGSTRRWKRRIGRGDIKDGIELGVRTKYHFSVRETRPIRELPAVIFAAYRSAQ